MFIVFPTQIGQNYLVVDAWSLVRTGCKRLQSSQYASFLHSSVLCTEFPKRKAQFHPIFGPFLMVTYACLSNTLLLTILVSVSANPKGWATILTSVYRYYRTHFPRSTKTLLLRFACSCHGSWIYWRFFAGNVSKSSFHYWRVCSLPSIDKPHACSYTSVQELKQILCSLINHLSTWLHCS